MAAFVLACVGSACASSGSVELEFLLPTVDSLSPIGAGLAQITVVTRAPGEAPTSATREVSDGSSAIEMGTLQVGDGLTIEVELRSPTQRLIGFGRSAGPVDVLADAVTEVPIMLRRPFAYVTGGGGIATFDASLDAALPYRGEIPTGPRPTAVAATHSGGQLAVAAPSGGNGQLSLILTADHKPADSSPVPLASAPSSVALSSDDRWAVIGHAGGGGGLSVVALDEVSAGTATAGFAQLGSVEAVAIDSTNPDGPVAFALLDRSEVDQCTGGTPASRIVGVDLADPTRERVAIAYAGPLHDFAVDGDTGMIAVADYCHGQVVGIDSRGDVEQRTTLLSLRSPGAVAILDGRVWAIGANPPIGEDGAALVLASIGLDGSGETRVDLPPQQERAQSVDFSGSGQAAEIRMNADLLRAYDLAVVPGGDQVAVLLRAFYHADQTGDFLGQPIIPDMDLDAYEYMLINASTGASVQRVRTLCHLTWESDPFNPPFLDAWTCSQASGQDVLPAADEYTPVQVEVLYGAR